jgi:hypothetical protein
MTSEVVTFVDPHGVETVLSNREGLKVLRGMTGRFMPPVVLLGEEVPGQDGERLRQVKIQSRRVFVPIAIFDETLAGMRGRLRTLLPTFNPKRGDGLLRVTAPDDSQRELVCRYAGGLEIEETYGNVPTQKAGLAFQASDPYFRDVIDTISSYTVEAAEPFFPFFPMRLSAGAVLSGAALFNAGDVEAWPVWTISGPADEITLTNDTTGESLTLDANLIAGQSLTIDTRPGSKAIKRNDDTNLYPGLDGTSRLWSLPAGTSVVSIGVTGATTDTVVTLRFRCRYLGV